jgi:AcrR family transcriptional regulator
VAAAETDDESQIDDHDSPIPHDGRELRSQGRKTMTTLLDAGKEVLTDLGYHAARVDDVVRIAGVSHGTFYLYFSSKEDLFRAMAQRCASDMEELAARLDEITADDAGLEGLRAWLDEFLGLYRRHGVVIRAWAEQHVDDRALRTLGSESFGHITETFRARLDAVGVTGRAGELKAAALLAMIERFAFLACTRDLGFDDDSVLETLAVTVHRGFFVTAD